MNTRKMLFYPVLFKQLDHSEIRSRGWTPHKKTHNLAIQTVFRPHGSKRPLFNSVPGISIRDTGRIDRIISEEARRTVEKQAEDAASRGNKIGREAQHQRLLGGGRPGVASAQGTRRCRRPKCCRQGGGGWRKAGKQPVSTVRCGLASRQNDGSSRRVHSSHHRDVNKKTIKPSPDTTSQPFLACNSPNPTAISHRTDRNVPRLLVAGYTCYVAPVTGNP